MAKIAGRLGRVAVSNDGGVTFFEVNGITDQTLNAAAAEINVTSHDSGQFEEFIQGRKDATLDLSLLWDEGDVGQGIIKTAFFSATQIRVRFRMQEGVGFAEFTQQAIVTSFAPASPNDDASTVDATLRISGSYTLNPQV